MMTDIPKYDQLMTPTLQALRQLGGSGTIEEIYARVSEIMQLTDDQLEVLYDPEKSSRTIVEDRLSWARTTRHVIVRQAASVDALIDVHRTCTGRAPDVHRTCTVSIRRCCKR